jgi:hypothetical protein
MRRVPPRCFFRLTAHSHRCTRLVRLFSRVCKFDQSRRHTRVISFQPMREARSAVTSMGLPMKPRSSGAALFLFAILLTGCGTGRPVGFVNETATHSDAQLMALWQQAQQNLSHQIYLNPVQHILYGTPEDLLPGDARALSFSPRMITIQATPDLTSAQLLVYGMDLPAPTGLIVCPQPCDQRVARAFSDPARHGTRVAASWERKELEWNDIIVYELENHILYGLGYNISWR